GPRCLVPRSTAAVIRPLALSLDLFPKSESSQQNGADKKEHGAYGQDIELQGNVHLRGLHGCGAGIAEARRGPEHETCCGAAGSCPIAAATAKPLKARGKKFLETRHPVCRRAGRRKDHAPPIRGTRKNNSRRVRSRVAARQRQFDETCRFKRAAIL